MSKISEPHRVAHQQGSGSTLTDDMLQFWQCLSFPTIFIADTRLARISLVPICQKDSSCLGAVPLRELGLGHHLTTTDDNLREHNLHCLLLISPARPTLQRLSRLRCCSMSLDCFSALKDSGFRADGVCAAGRFSA